MGENEAKIYNTGWFGKDESIFGIVFCGRSRILGISFWNFIKLHIIFLFSVCVCFGRLTEMKNFLSGHACIFPVFLRSYTELDFMGKRVSSCQTTGDLMN